MDPAHKDILRRHREDIVSCLDIAHVKDSLIQNGVFNTEQWEAIATAWVTRNSKASALMDELPRRGPDAFKCFCEALKTSYKFLADVLLKEDQQQVSAEAATKRGQTTKLPPIPCGSGVKRNSHSSLKAEEKHSSSDEGVGAEAMSHEPKQQNVQLDRTPSQPQQISNSESGDNTSAAILEVVLNLTSKVAEMGMEMGKMRKDHGEKLDTMGRKMDEYAKLLKQNNDITNRLEDVSELLDNIEKDLTGEKRAAVETISKLRKRVQDVLDQEFDRPTLMQEIEDIAAVEVLKLRPYVPVVEDSPSSQAEEMGTQAGMDVEEEQDDINPWDQAAARTQSKDCTSRRKTGYFKAANGRANQPP
ncbi:Hypp6288 [Branchiostoma lanceolatum]|uniref:Hypp6288 protein n=1 Tax=Branchiostoma lanceolatum TaxID=7740 RepID=A0A8J9YSS8_BRALA|nr:Hypp6288 [Branchiostoma lanceolatum]